MILEQGGNFEKPESGAYIGIIADVVELYGVKSSYAGQERIQNKVRIVWVLDKNDSTGKPYNVILQVNASMNEKAKLFDAVKAVLGQAPNPRFDTESLIGRANRLFVMKEKSVDGTKEFANVKGIMPLQTGDQVPRIPTDFVREKVRKAQTQAGQIGITGPAANTQVPAPQTQPAAQPAIVGGFGQYIPPPQPVAQQPPSNARF